MFSISKPVIICFAKDAAAVFKKTYLKNSLTYTMLYCNVYVCTFLVIICWHFNWSNTQFPSQCSHRRFNVCGILGWMKRASFPWQSLGCVLADPLLSLRSQLQPQSTPLSPTVDCTAQLDICTHVRWPGQVTWECTLPAVHCACGSEHLRWCSFIYFWYW